VRLDDRQQILFVDFDDAIEALETHEHAALTPAPRRRCSRYLRRAEPLAFASRNRSLAIAANVFRGGRLHHHVGRMPALQRVRAVRETDVRIRADVRRAQGVRSACRARLRRAARLALSRLTRERTHQRVSPSRNASSDVAYDKRR
jgi:hypothetical protein